MSMSFALAVQHTSLEPRLSLKVISTLNLFLSSKHVRYVQRTLYLNSILTSMEVFASFPQQRQSPSTFIFVNLVSILLNLTIS